MFAAGPAEPGRSAGRVRAPVAKTFRVYDQGQSLLLPPSLRDWLPEDHLALFVSELVDEVLDLGPFLSAYTEARGYPPYDPRLMLKIVLYGYTTGVRSSRAIERRCHDDVAFRFLSANAAPDFRSVARFRRRHLLALEALFVQVLMLCREAGMASMGRVALDGTKVKANASRHKAMSYDRMGEAEARLAGEVEALLGEAERLDAEQDEALGPDERGADLCGELARRESRLAKIRKAKADLEAQARDKAAAAERDKACDGAQRDGETVWTERGIEQPARPAGRAGDPAPAAGDAAGAERGSEQAKRVAETAAAATPEPRAQRNFTDPDSRIMKTADGSFHYCYNAQAVVDADHQVIVATAFAASGADSPAFADLLDQTSANTGVVPDQTLADAGYFSAGNVEAARARGTDAFIATGRLKHGDRVPDAPCGPAPEGATPKQRMAHKLRTTDGKAVYARRKVIVEPVFGQMKTTQGAGRLLLRGRQAALAEWRLMAACHNLRKLFSYSGIEGLAAT